MGAATICEKLVVEQKRLGVEQKIEVVEQKSCYVKQKHEPGWEKSVRTVDVEQNR
ncbi:hypothetical protein [Sutcliffiella sp. NC1]|uniref:hypothetical protein n=1 Tax=Sutcliffiella sp. NC1 TaxID=3004096 RepID=UPI0022DDC250|nr:hypothetical protein [Sutcliffiella sp. NC1]WBL15574.1 hypothetical protein O1A01_02680 [Sutcliffiella sp. NC1]